MNFKSVAGIIIGIAVLFGALFLLKPKNQPLPAVEQLPEQIIEEIEPTIYLFEIPVDSFEVVQSEFGKNEFLGTVLDRFHVSAVAIDKLARASKDIYDVRKFRTGKNYTVFSTTDSIPQVAYFVYQPNAIDYVVYDMRDSLQIYTAKKELVTQERTASGVINSSLYQTLIDQNVSPALAVRLADIYAWTIDFYRIQKGDNFKVIFEEQFVDGERVGVGRILGANFNNYGVDNYAFLYDQGEGDDYFNEEAESLRRAFLKSPLKYGRLTSAYTKRRFHPVQKRYKAHLGTDYAAPTGTPIMTVGDGVVTHAKYSKYNGNFVKIRHNATFTTQYLHMSKIGKGIRPGTRVKQGQTIGYVGSTGLATGPHVCYRFWKNGKQVDSRREKIPPSNPIKKDKRADFDVFAIAWKAKIDSIPPSAIL
ncbi:MAG: murein DD-endopeptidase MepM/ murein hydrolase activator NlpD [Salibacteraceae bacterium]|jgi:murein DD-endopeptidase MepM/ murein hydrolase activator NlpD